MSARLGRRRTQGAEVHNDERWMASYMDMVTVLMCMFIVLFAMSSVDADKFEALRDSLATGFGQDPTTFADTAEGIIVPAELEGDDEEFTDLELARQELESLLAIRDRIDAGLAAQGIEHAVSYDIDERGLIVRLIGAETYFLGNSVDLSGKAEAILGVVGGVLATVHHEVSVEGHADPHGSSGPFPTDWELASGRATQVVRYLVERTGVGPERAAAIGYGSARPVTSAADESAMALNRRVDVVVVSDQPESVRALLPELAERLAEVGSEPPARGASATGG
ncbi:flagellar motor protein MotB [Agromyces sp. NPDC056379]|uniref:flagellar motor protein MotB n=1 Tax=unclassified Agromyces TaxID=2639701 RepID=UPI0035DA8AE5